MANSHAPIYDTIGVNYDELRLPDPRISHAIRQALGDVQSVLNVGAGTGSYEPNDLTVTAVEPSSEMISKRPRTAAPVVKASAESLPFEDDSFDAAMAVLTVHHWSDQAKGLAEMRRVARGPVVLLTYDPACRPWLTDYLPELAELDKEQMPAMSAYADVLGNITVKPVPIPHDCSDGFLYAYWRRPEMYLDARLRTGISSFWALRNLNKGLERLRVDVETGAWAKRYAGLLGQDEYDAGYRLIIGA